MLDKETKQAILDAVERVVDYAHANKIDTVLLAGRKAGHFHDLFRILWRRKYRTRSPFFVSPGNIDTFHPKERAAVVKEALARKKLLENLKGNVLVFDECIVSGRTMFAYDKALKELGVKHVLASVFAGGGNLDTARVTVSPGLFIGKRLKAGKINEAINDFLRSQDNLRYFRSEGLGKWHTLSNNPILWHKQQQSAFKRLKRAAHKKPR